MDTAFLASRTGTSLLPGQPPYALRGGSSGSTVDAFASPREEFAIPEWLLLDDVDVHQPNPLISVKSTTGTFSAHQALAGQATTAWATDLGLELLAEAAQNGNEARFAVLSDQIDWKNRGPEALTLGIRYALYVGAHTIARQLTAIAREQYGDDEGLQKFIEVLAPPTVERAALPPNERAAADMRWLKTHREAYRGQWVALQSGVLLASAETWKDLLARLEDPKDKSILVTMVY